MTPCSLVGRYQRFEGKRYRRFSGYNFHHADSRFLRNISNYLPKVQCHVIKFLLWRWRQEIILKRWYPLTKLSGLEDLCRSKVLVSAKYKLISLPPYQIPRWPASRSRLLHAIERVWLGPQDLTVVLVNTAFPNARTGNRTQASPCVFDHFTKPAGQKQKMDDMKTLK
jgi:hypothetical protein